MNDFGPSTRRKKNLQQAQFVRIISVIVFIMYVKWYLMSSTIFNGRQLKDKKRNKKRLRIANLEMLIKESDVKCKNELRMNRHTFNVLCEMVSDIGGLKGSRNMSIREIVAMFLYVLSHHKKNRSIGTYFIRSGETISRYFNLCLKAILKLHDQLLKKPTPIADDCPSNKWKCFKNCLGALDGTYISVSVPNEDKAKYRTRKGNIAMNVLGVCSPDMHFIYVLPGWEGSAHDGRVLRDAISRPNGLKIPQGCYYLVDAGYTNGEGFLAPYRGQRYHLNEWRGDRQPQSAEEYFNMKHSKARNVIERCFSLLKGRWSILRSCSFYPVRTQGRIIMACCLLHNLIRKYMPTDTMIEQFYEEEEDEEDEDEEYEDEKDKSEDLNEVEYITTVQTFDNWTNFRNNLAQEMFNSWRVQCSRH